VALRYAVTQPDSLLATFIPQQKQYALCITKFISNHQLKVQAEIQFLEDAFRKNGVLLNQAIRQYMAGFLQIELGI
jgi:polyhydroxyalkanoate synthesis regulator protein